MGTASTMASIAEALGMALPGSAAIPAVHADRLRAAEASGRCAVELIKTGLKPSQIITEKSVENALRVLLAIGGSTNAIVHLTAIAGRAGIKIDLKHLNQLSDSTPVLVDLKPTGQHYMSDLYAAGGVGAVMRELKPLLHLDCMTVAGITLGEVLDKPAGVGRPRRGAAVQGTVLRRRAAWSRCSARSRRTARSSSARPRIPKLFEKRRPRGGVLVARRPLGAHRRPAARHHGR